MRKEIKDKKVKQHFISELDEIAVEMERVWKKIGKPQFRGEGFYETDYKEKPKEKNDNIRVDKPDFNP